MEINTVREKRIDGELIGYFVNECAYFQKDDCPQVNQWIAQGNTPEPEFTEDELAKEELQNKLQEANAYLAQTDWVNTYNIRHDLGLELIPEESSKWEVINKREECIVFLKAIEGVK